MAVPKIKRGASRAILGDLFEMKTRCGLAYFQFVNKHAEFGQLIRVLPGVHNERPQYLERLVGEKELYFVFFPVSAAAARGFVSKVANLPVPTWAEAFPTMRRPGARGSDGKILNWFLVNDRGEQFLKNLSDEQRTLSLAVIWNDTLLAERICSGWVPAHEG